MIKRIFAKLGYEIIKIPPPIKINESHKPDVNKLALEPTPFHLYMMSNINLLVTEHCSLNCAYCSTGAPFANKKSHSVESFFKWLDILEDKDIQFKSIAITGGEPFLNSEILDGSFIEKLKNRYPSKRIGLTTNFFWASEERITKYAPVINKLNGLSISIYKTIVEKLGGSEEYNRLILLLKKLCPDTSINVHDQSMFSVWEFHQDRQDVEKPCGTSDCFILTPNGKLSHCSLAIGANNTTKYKSIINNSKEAFFDLSELKDKEVFFSWQQKYPIDLCFYCTFWKGNNEPWHLLEF